MKTFIFTLILACLIASCTKTKNEGDTSSQIVSPAEETIHIIAEQTVPDTLKGSLKAKAMGTIGNTGISVNYYSPAVRGRVIWGGLVPLDNVWVTGAHRATNIDFTQEVTIGAVKIAAGKYGFFTIPGKDEWIVIINKNWDQHLADDYNEKEDVVRVNIKPEMQDQSQERLMYLIQSSTPTSGIMQLRWEKLMVNLTIESHN